MHPYAWWPKCSLGTLLLHQYEENLFSLGNWGPWQETACSCTSTTKIRRRTCMGPGPCDSTQPGDSTHPEELACSDEERLKCVYGNLKSLEPHK